MPEPHTSGLISISGYSLPKIKVYRCNCEDIDSNDTQRDEIGTLHRKVVRKKVVKVSVTFCGEEADITSIANSIEDDTVTATVYCPTHPNAENGYFSSDFYVSKTGFELIHLSETEHWLEMSFNMIEV